MLHKILLTLLLVAGIGITSKITAQDSTETTEETATEIYIIESFIPAESRNELHLSFFTSEACKSKVVISERYEFPVNDSLTENHKVKINIAGVPVSDSLPLNFVIVVENASGVSATSEIYEIQVPAKEEKPLVESKGSDITGCLYGAAIYMIPIYDHNFFNGTSSWGLSKELPLVSFYGGGYNYPTHFISAEYSYINDIQQKNYFRIGWKKLWDLKNGSFVVLGANGVSDFKGYNGFSPEVTYGFYSFSNNVFSLYARYRFTTNFTASERNFHTVSLGLYSWFFSVQK